MSHIKHWKTGKQYNIIQIWLHKLLKLCTQTLYTQMVYFGGVSGVCHDWQFDFDRTFGIGILCTSVHAPAFLPVGWGSALQVYCTTACSWFTRLFFNNIWSKIKWHVWLIRGGSSASNTSRYWNSIAVNSFPSLLLLGFIFSSSNSLYYSGSQTRDQLEVIT